MSEEVSHVKKNAAELLAGGFSSGLPEHVYLNAEGIALVLKVLYVPDYVADSQ